MLFRGVVSWCGFCVGLSLVLGTFLNIKFRLICYTCFLFRGALQVFLTTLSNFVCFQVGGLRGRSVGFGGVMTMSRALLGRTTLRRLGAVKRRIIMCRSFPARRRRIVHHVNGTSYLLMSFHAPVHQSILSTYPGVHCVNVYYALCGPRDSGISIVRTHGEKVAILKIGSCNSRNIIRCIIDRLIHLLRNFNGIH